MTEGNVSNVMDLDSEEQRTVLVHVMHGKGFVWDADGACKIINCPLILSFIGFKTHYFRNLFRCRRVLAPRKA